MSKARVIDASPSSKKIQVRIDDGLAGSRAAKHAESLIEQMMKEMERGLLDRDYLISDEWERLFGAKQSMVANLQKLVATLAALPIYQKLIEQAEENAAEMKIASEDMELLQAWVDEGNTLELDV